MKKIFKFEDYKKPGRPVAGRVDPEAPATVEVPAARRARAREAKDDLSDLLAAWEAELERATADRLQREAPGMSRNQAEALALVMDDNDGQTVWVAVGGTIRYAVNTRTGAIREASDQHKGPVKTYCKIDDWAAWEWGDHYPWRKGGS